MYSLKFSMWLERTLGMYLSAGGWLYLHSELRGEVVEMTFSSINFDCCGKLFGSILVIWVVYNEDALLMIYWSIPYWDILPKVKILKNSYNLQNIHKIHKIINL